ncbi:MAG: DUF2207 domain-containing protein [Pseudomonadota bacterium]
MKIGTGILAACLIALFSIQTGQAQERIEAFDSVIEIQPDGSLEVTETIRVRAEGQQIRRGIVREFPTRYRDRYGNRVIVDFEMIEVQRNGNPEPWFTKRVSNGIHINTGDDSFLPVPASIEYTIRYRTDRQLGFFEEHDELYWNVTGNGSIFTIDSASAEVRLPETAVQNQMQAEAYTGEFGQQGRNARAEIIGADVFRFETMAPLPPRSGLTVVAKWPKGIIPEPTRQQRLGWLLHDNRSVLIMLIGLIAVFLYYLHQWRQKGRDPEPGVIFARYNPPKSYSPGGLRYMIRRMYDARCFAADLVDLGVKGKLKIQREKGSDGVFGKGEVWTVEQTRSISTPDLPSSQKAILETLFEDENRIELKTENAQLLMQTRKAQAKALVKRYRPDYFVTNWKVLTIGFIASIGLIVLALIIGQGSALPLTIGLAVVMMLMNFMFIWLMQRVTARGRKLLDQIEGLKRYLDVAEQQDLATLEHRNPDEPELNAARFEALLPYALALDVEQAWTQKFEAAAGVTAAAAAAAAGSMAWYYGSGVKASSLGDLGSSLGKGFTSQISSASTPPGSSSGGGGGGFSGGGGGGGGVGGR